MSENGISQLEFPCKIGFSIFDVYNSASIIISNNKIIIKVNDVIIKQLDYASINQIEYDVFSTYCILYCFNNKKISKIRISLFRRKSFLSAMKMHGVSITKKPMIYMMFK